MTDYYHEQSSPTLIDHNPIYIQVLKSFITQIDKGQRTYNTPLAPFNRRNSLQDAIQECVDLLFYLHNEDYERQIWMDFIRDVVNEYEKVVPLASATLPRKLVDALDNLSLALRHMEAEGDG
jgi:hypothetical protein